MINSILAQLINSLFKQQKTNPISENDFFELIKKSIRDEISKMILKILFGVVLAATAIFSLIQIGLSFQLILTKIENGFLYDFLIFGFVTLISLLLLFKIFNQSFKKITIVSASSNSPNELFDLGKLTFKFVEGFLEGFAKEPTDTSKPKVPTQESR